MRNTMNEQGDVARRALHLEDSNPNFDLGYDPGLIQEVVQTFRGHRRWAVWYVWISSFVIAAFAFYCGYRFLVAEAVQSQIGWASGFLYSGLVVAILKVWYWNEMNRNTYLRELKRLEFQVAKLTERIEEHLSS